MGDDAVTVVRGNVIGYYTTAAAAVAGDDGCTGLQAGSGPKWPNWPYLPSVAICLAPTYPLPGLHLLVAIDQCTSMTPVHWCAEAEAGAPLIGTYLFLQVLKSKYILCKGGLQKKGPFS